MTGKKARENFFKSSKSIDQSILNGSQCSTYCNGDSEPFSAIARIALSNGVCTFAHAKSNSVKLCAHFDAINSKPPLQRIEIFKFLCESHWQRGKFTQCLVSPSIRTKINVSSPTWAVELDCHALVSHNLGHLTAVILYLFSEFFE